MVIDMGGEHIGVSYGKIKRTPGQLDCERAREIFEGVQPQAVRIGLTVAEDIDEISENLREAMPDVLHLSGDIEGISPAEVAELKSRFPELKIDLFFWCCHITSFAEYQVARSDGRPRLLRGC